jgi:hypothetical protein
VVLVHKAAEAVATLDIAAGRYELGRLERESAVGTLAVVVLDVDAQDVYVRSRLTSLLPIQSEISIAPQPDAAACCR